MVLQGRILITKAMSRLAIEGPDASFGVLDHVRELAGAHGETMLAVRARVQEGAIHTLCSNWTEVIDTLAHVAPHFAVLEPHEQAATLLNRGLALVSLSRLEEGRDDLERALELARDHGFVAVEFKARHNLGCVAYFAGDIPKALRLMAEAASMDTGVGLAQAHLDHAKVLLDAGLVDEGEQFLERGLECARHDRQRLERGEIQLELARAAMLRGDHSHARIRAAQAIRTFGSLRAVGRAQEVELLRAAIDISVGQHLARAAEVADQWSTADPNLRSARLATRIRVEAALARGDTAAARTEFARLDPSQPQALGVQLHERLLESRLATTEGDSARATAILRRAAELLARDQSSVQSFEVRAGLALHAGRIRDADVGAATDSGSDIEVFESVERWRAPSQRTSPLVTAEDTETLALVGRLRQLRHHGAREGQDEAVSAMNALQSAISERLRAAPGSPQAIATSPVTFDEACTAAADRGASIVTFHEIRGALVRLVVSESSIRRHVVAGVDAVGSITSAALADARAAALARPSMAAILGRARQSSLQAVDSALLDGLELTEHVVIVPTVGLAALPWRALPSLRDRAVVAAPSVTAWVRRATTSASKPTVRALAGPGLARSREEVDAVTEVWGRHTGADTVTDDSPYAGSADVRAALGSASVVHLAAHGRHVDQSPLFSSLDMADGPVFAHELRAPLSAELVVLSACDVGRSRGRPGDEPLGLAAALLSLGVQCVVASTTPVPDDVAATAMVDLHEQLVEGVDVATALRHTAARVPGAEAFCAYGSTWSVPNTAGAGQMKRAGSRNSAS